MKPALPGVYISDIDIRGMVPAQTPSPSSKTLLIIGSAIDGPSNVPVAVGNMSDVYTVFGSAYKSYAAQDGPGTAYPSLVAQNRLSNPTFNGNTLALAANEALLAGAPRVLCLRLDLGDQASTILQGGESPADRLTLYARFNGSLYNSLNATSYADLDALEADKARVGYFAAVRQQVNASRSFITAGAREITLVEDIEDWITEGDLITIAPGSPPSISESGSPSSSPSASASESPSSPPTVATTYAVISRISNDGSGNRRVITLSEPAADNYNNNITAITINGMLLYVSGLHGGVTFKNTWWDGLTTWNEFLGQLTSNAKDWTPRVYVELADGTDGNAAVDLVATDPTSVTNGRFTLGTNGTINEFQNADTTYGDPRYYANSICSENSAPDTTLMENFYTAVEDLFVSLSSYDFDFVVLADFTTESAALSGESWQLLTDLCATMIDAGKFCYGVMGLPLLQNPDNPDNIAQRVTDLTMVSTTSMSVLDAVSDGITVNYNGENKSGGWLMNFIVGPQCRMQLRGGNYSSNMAAWYAGAICSRAVTESMDRASNPMTPEFVYSDAQVSALSMPQPSDNGTRQSYGGYYTVFRMRYNEFSVNMANTAAREGEPGTNSGLTDFMASSVLLYIIKNIKVVVDKYIGLPLNDALVTFVTNDITAVMVGAQKANLLRNPLNSNLTAYQVTNKTTDADFSDGRLVYYLSFTPSKTLRTIMLGITVYENGNVSVNLV